MKTVKDDLQQSLQNWVSAKGIVQFVEELSAWLQQEGFWMGKRLSFKCYAYHEGYEATITVNCQKSNNSLSCWDGKGTVAKVEVKLLRGISGKPSSVPIATKEWAIREDVQLIAVLGEIKRYVRSLTGREFGWEDGEG